jgi:hypothetical protein
VGLGEARPGILAAVLSDSRDIRPRQRGWLSCNRSAMAFDHDLSHSLSLPVCWPTRRGLSATRRAFVSRARNG